MKRKRSTESTKRTHRPFKKREELLNDCLCLCLKYNVHFSQPSADLSWYRLAETLQDEDIYVLNDKMANAIHNDECLPVEQVA